MMTFKSRWILWLVGLGLSGTNLLAAAGAKEAPDQLPEQTVAYVNVHDTRELVRRFHETSLGMALRDPQLSPLVKQLWGSITPMLEGVKERSGVSVEELLSSSPGELVIALVDIPAFPPAPVLMFQAEESDKSWNVLRQGEDKLVSSGFERVTEDFKGVSATILSANEGPIEEIIQMQLGSWRVITTNRRAAEKMIALHVEANKRSDLVPLRSNAAFRTIHARCNESREKMLYEWFVDPINLAKAAMRGNFAAQAGLAILPAIGADDLQGIGGASTLATSDFDQLHHFHVLIDQPRDGVFEALALTQGSLEPELWVAADVSDYTTWHFDLKKGYQTAKKLIDSFQNDGATKAFLDRRISEPMGVDFERELLMACSGRISRTVVFPPNATVNDAWTIVGVELVDAQQFATLFNRVAEKFREHVERVNFGGVDLLRVKNAEADENAQAKRAEGDERAPGRRQGPWRNASPTAAIIGDYLVMSNHREAVEQCVMVFNNAKPRLMDELEYKLVVSKLKRQSASPPSMIAFQRPEQGLAAMYRMLQTDSVKQNLHQRRDEQPWIATLDDAIQQNRLPSFDVVAQYFAPAGTAIFNEESGIHYVSFGLRRQITSVSSSTSK